MPESPRAGGINLPPPVILGKVRNVGVETPSTARFSVAARSG
jgi:hypothetical protein